MYVYKNSYVMYIKHNSEIFLINDVMGMIYTFRVIRKKKLNTFNSHGNNR